MTIDSLDDAVEAIALVLADLGAAQTPVQLDVFDHVPASGNNGGAYVCVDLRGLVATPESFTVPVRLFVRQTDARESQAQFRAHVDVVESAIDRGSYGADFRCDWAADLECWVAEWLVEILRDS